MSSPRQIVDLTSFEGRVAAAEGVLHVGDATVPLIDILVILTGISGSYHPSVVNRAAAFDIPIVHCDWRGVPIAVTYAWSANSRVASRHNAQATLSAPRGKNAWMQIIRSKIKGQAINLRGKDAAGVKYLLDLRGRVQSGDPSNMEGQAARYYWPRVFGNSEFLRIPGARMDDANAFLDYGYTILRGASIRAVVTAGLCPALGIWHHQRDNSFALADDLMEPFRPAVDAMVAQLLQIQDELTPEVKKALAGTLDKRFNKNGHTVSTEITMFAQRLARYVEGEIQTLQVPEFDRFNEDG